MTFSLKETIMSEIKIRRIRSLGSKPTLWPSQASAVQEDGTVLGKCIRSSFYGKLGLPETNPVSDAVSVMGYMGTKIEDGIIDILKNQGIWENNNVKWQANGLSGEVDVIIRIPELPEGKTRVEDSLYVVEVKSCSGYYANKEVYGYNSGRGSNKKWNTGKPKDPHLMQAAIYADISRDKCKGTIVIYVSRDEAKLADFLVTVDEDGTIFIDGVKELRFTMKDVYDRYDSLRWYLDQKRLPQVDYKHTYTDEEVRQLYERKGISAAAKKAHLDKSKPYMDKNCMYCAYRDRCKEDGLEEQENYITEKEEPVIKEKSYLDWFEQPVDISDKETPNFMIQGSF